MPLINAHVGVSSNAVGLRFKLRLIYIHTLLCDQRPIDTCMASHSILQYHRNRVGLVDSDICLLPILKRQARYFL